MREPEQGKWNIKADQTWVLAQNWDEWCQVLGIQDARVSGLVKQLLDCFEVVYTWSFDNVYAQAILARFKANAQSFVAKWRHFVAGGKMRNYYHWLAHEAARQIDHSGSIWKYSSAVTESMVHVLKDCWAKFTNRGGCGRHWTKQVLARTLVKITIKSLAADDVLSIMTPYERKLYLQKVVETRDMYSS